MTHLIHLETRRVLVRKEKKKKKHHKAGHLEHSADFVSQLTCLKKKKLLITFIGSMPQETFLEDILLVITFGALSPH